MPKDFSTSGRERIVLPKSGERQPNQLGQSFKAAVCEPVEKRLFLSVGATVPYTTYLAENGTYTGALMGPSYTPNTEANEAVGREFVRLSSVGQYVQFTAAAAANSIVVRYSIPDSTNGGGINSTVSLYINNMYVQKLAVTSTLSWLYGTYPFTNTPSDGSPRNFFDEVRLSGLTINAGDTVRIERDSGDTAASYDDVNLVDLEEVGPALTEPTTGNWVNVTAAPYDAVGNGTTDDTTAIRNAVAAAMSEGANVWVPPGTYMLSGFIQNLNNVTIQGAGMWYTNFIGNPAVYNTTPADRVGFMGAGSNIHLNDFSITGDLDYRNDSEANDGIGGSFGTGSSISDLWIEHTKVGMWITNSDGLTITNCRVRDTIADGINIDVGMLDTTVSNCTTRGTGDDCFAIWPATYESQTYTPGFNVITNCTGLVPFLANGGAIYGGESNSIQNCLFQDIGDGSGVLISSTFAVGANTFSGTTTVENSEINRAGGSSTLAGVQFAASMNPISGVALSGLTIINNPYSGLGVTGPDALSATASNLSIQTVGLGASGSYGVYVATGSSGSLSVISSTVGTHHDSSGVNFTLSFSGPTVVNPAAANVAAAGTSISLTALGSDPAGANTLTYTWAATTVPGAVTTPSFDTNNGTNAGQSEVATVYGTGAYTFQVTITDASNLSIASSVNVTVSQVLSSVVVTPATLSLPVSSTYQFAASAQDQFANAISGQTFTWSVTGANNSITQAGLLTLDGPKNRAQVAATDGSVTGTAIVTPLAAAAPQPVTVTPIQTPSPPVSGGTTGGGSGIAVPATPIAAPATASAPPAPTTVTAPATTTMTTPQTASPIATSTATTAGPAVAVTTPQGPAASSPVLTSPFTPTTENPASSLGFWLHNHGLHGLASVGRHG